LPTRIADRSPKDSAHVCQQSGVSRSELTEETGRVFDVGEKEGHDASGQRANIAGPRLDLRPHTHVYELACDEADRHDPVPLRRFEQPRARPIPRRFVLESGLVEARKRVADVGLVINR